MAEASIGWEASVRGHVTDMEPDVAARAAEAVPESALSSRVRLREARRR